jgi:asparagine synthetase B (glutamine-hydrolysing)
LIKIIEKTLEYLEGDFSFVLFDMNLYGEETLLYVVRDCLGLCPLYQLVPNTNSKKVQFYDDNVDVNQYIFSSSVIETPTDNFIYEPMLNGTYSLFTHSFKVSANWKLKNNIRYYTLPFYSTYITSEESITTDSYLYEIEIALNKRMRYISQQSVHKNVVGVIFFEKQKELELNLLSILNKNESLLHYKIISFLDKNPNELEEKYPTLIQQLKQKINNNDPYIIRSYFIPLIIAKYIKENEPHIKYVFMVEPFIYKWIFINIFDRREAFHNSFFQERLKGWIDAFFEYDIELIIPYLDRTLLQKI